MPLNFDIQLLVQAILYLAVFVTGFAISIPLGVTNIRMKGCILFAKVTWVNSTLFHIQPSTNGNCSFPIYVCVFVCILYGLAMSIYFGYAVLKRDREIGFQMWVMPFILTTAVVCIAVFIAAFMISVGFKEFCDGLTKGVSEVGEHWIETCSDAQSPAVKWGNGEQASTFYIFLTVAQLAVWVCFLFWAAQLALCILRFIRVRRRRSQGTFQDGTSDVNSTKSDKVQIASVEPTA